MPAPRRSRLTVALLGLLLLTAACSSAVPRRDPVGEVFPTVTGESLTGEQTELPAALEGEPAVLLVGYLQETQFDIDRWLMGLLQAEVPARVVELPTIPGLVPSMASGWIDAGMRSGIPEEDWSAVITVYGSEAAPIAELTGTEGGRNARVLLLDADGQVVWFHDRGYSARLAIELVEAIRGLSAD